MSASRDLDEKARRYGVQDSTKVRRAKDTTDYNDTAAGLRTYADRIRNAGGGPAKMPTPVRPGLGGEPPTAAFATLPDGTPAPLVGHGAAQVLDGQNSVSKPFYQQIPTASFAGQPTDIQFGATPTAAFPMAQLPPARKIDFNADDSIMDADKEAKLLGLSPKEFADLPPEVQGQAYQMMAGLNGSTPHQDFSQLTPQQQAQAYQMMAFSNQQLPDGSPAPAASPPGYPAPYGSGGSASGGYEPWMAALTPAERQVATAPRQASPIFGSSIGDNQQYSDAIDRAIRGRY